ncbi:hypothetical protein F5887DRAFT_978305 [Amanita rubescens]|nr:hypothetical protein F5887DRAFT_978305 [Amanita rubescens]
MSTNPEALRLTEAMTMYYILFETCSQCVRTLPNKSQLYKEAAEKWQSRSEFYRPSRGDEAARAKFFSAVDKACKTESRAPENCYLIIFACSAAIQIIIDQDLVKLCDLDRRHIMNESQRLSAKQLMANMDLPPTSNSSAAARLPPHLASAFFPANRPKQAFEELVGKQVSYRDPKNGKTRECTVMDHITSHLRGTYYVITDNDGWDEEVNEDEMQDMLDMALQSDHMGIGHSMANLSLGRELRDGPG